MKRTQIYIPEETHLGAQGIADRLDISVAEVYRKYIEKGLNLNKERKQHGSASALLSLKYTSGPKDLSKNHTKYLVD